MWCVIQTGPHGAPCSNGLLVPFISPLSLQKETYICGAQLIRIFLANLTFIFPEYSKEKQINERIISGEGMATHSSILAWKNPWTEESGGLKSMGLHDWACVHEGGGRRVGSNKLVELKKIIIIILYEKLSQNTHIHNCDSVYIFQSLQLYKHEHSTKVQNDKPEILLNV